MSYFAVFDETPAGDVATISGWRDFVAFVKSSNAGDEIRHLAEHGWNECDMPELADQLEEILEVGDPSDDQESTGRGLLEQIRAHASADIVIITDGTS